MVGGIPNGIPQNRGKLPLLNGLKIRVFCLWHAARESDSEEMDTPVDPPEASVEQTYVQKL